LSFFVMASDHVLCVTPSDPQKVTAVPVLVRSQFWTHVPAAAHWRVPSPFTEHV